MRIFVEYDALICVLLLINNILTRKSSRGDGGKYIYILYPFTYLSHILFLSIN